MPRSYRYIKEYEQEIVELKKQGKTNQEIRKTLLTVGIFLRLKSAHCVKRLTLQKESSKTDRGLRKALKRKRHLSVNGTSPKEHRSKKNIMKGGRCYER